MRWKRRPRSRNLEDRRGEGGARRSPFPFPLGGRAGGGRIPIPRGRGGKLSIGGLVLVLGLVWLMGGDVFQVLGEAAVQSRAPGGGGAGLPSGSAPADTRAAPPRASPQEEERVDFVSFVLDDLQTTWPKILPNYRDAKLVLFRDSVRSGCGFAAAQMGPFYCPADEKVYVDLSFFEELSQRFAAPGDFAQAYVLAHEVGHHIQKLTGIEPQVRRAQEQNPRRKNELSVRMELQADCLAGVWGHSTAQRQILEQGDVEEGLAAASAIGDDRLQRMSTGRVQPEAFTHGSSEQRVRWFRRGFETGDPDRCDTFEAERL